MFRKMLSMALLLVMLLTAACAEAVIVPYGEELSFQTQITPSGKARLKAGTPYETLSFTIKVTGNRGPVHFKKYYAEDFALKGTEAVAQIQLTLNDYQGQAKINPNNIILLTMQAENGDKANGYQMMNWEMGGNTDLPMVSNLPITAFKRYDFDEDDPNPMRYLVVHAFNNGAEQTYLMELADPAEQGSFYIIYDELKRKSRGKAVKELQKKLDELGLLKGSSIDGVYGPNTAESVKAAQLLLGFEETGVATHAFQKALYKYMPAQ